MIEVLQKIAVGKWFNDSPFTCDLQIGNDSLCIITGNNASGKSLVRKVLSSHYHSEQIEFINLSMCGRTGGNFISGFQKLFIYGDESEESTGDNSAKILGKAIKTGLSREKPFVLFLDEPEVGCGEELQMAMALSIVNVEVMPMCKGIYIVSHSRQFVRHFIPLNPTHFRLGDKMTLVEWLSREVVPVDLSTFSSDNHEKWRWVESQLKKKV